MSFKSRLVVFTTVWFCLAAAAIALTYNWQKETIELRTQQSLHKELASHMRDDNPLMIGTDYNPKALKSIFHTLMLIGPDFEIYFLDSQGISPHMPLRMGQSCWSRWILLRSNSFYAVMLSRF